MPNKEKKKKRKEKEKDREVLKIQGIFFTDFMETWNQVLSVVGACPTKFLPSL